MEVKNKDLKWVFACDYESDEWIDKFWINPKLF